MITTNYTIGDIPNAPRGWICPKCGNVLAPSMSFCTFCSTTEKTVITSDKTNPSPKLPDIIIGKSIIPTYIIEDF